MRLLQSPNADMKALSIVAPIVKGGTGADNSTEAVQNLGGLNAAFLGQPNGVAKLNAQGKLEINAFPDMVMVGPTLNGPTIVYTGQTVQYNITNYDINTTYTVSASIGTLTRSGDTLTYVAPATPGNMTLTVNNKTASVSIQNTAPIAPSITSPVTGSTGIMSSVSATSSPFAMNNDSDTHAASDWQVATDTGFTNIVSSAINDTVNKTSWTATGLTENTTYYMRARYKGTVYGYGAWSAVISFTTRNTFLPVYEQAILTASDKEADDNFGVSVCLSSDGSRVIIGANNANPSTLNNAGKAYVFSRTGAVWTQEAILTASDKVAGDNFGISVSMDSTGTRVVVGAHIAQSSSGKAYIYLRTGTSWSQEAILTPSLIAVSDQFGYASSMTGDGTRVLISAINADPDTVNAAGAVFVFTRSGTTWTEEALLKASNKAASDSFGFSVDVTSDGTRAVIGARLSDPGGINAAGAAYVFTRSGTTWTEEAILSASDKAASDGYGQSVSISSDGFRIAIGANTADPAGYPNAGKVYVYNRSGTTWTEEAILSLNNKAGNDAFGYAVQLSDNGSFLFSSALTADPNGVADAGSATVFTRSGSTWTEQNTISGSDKVTIDRYGRSLAISADGKYSAVGAIFTDPNNISGAGKVYVYS